MMIIGGGSGQSGCRWQDCCEGSPCARAPLPCAFPFPPPLALPSPRAVEPCLCGGGPPFPSPPRAPLSHFFCSLSLCVYITTSLPCVVAASAVACPRAPLVPRSETALWARPALRRDCCRVVTISVSLACVCAASAVARVRAPLLSRSETALPASPALRRDCYRVVTISALMIVWCAASAVGRAGGSLLRRSQKAPIAPLRSPPRLQTHCTYVCSRVCITKLGFEPTNLIFVLNFVKTSFWLLGGLFNISVNEP